MAGEDFSDLGTTAPPAIAPAPDVLASAGNAIAGIESGGKYNLVGPPDKTGDRPYGKYQVMGNNVPDWTDAAGVGRLSPQQFLASPDAQEKVFAHRFGGYLTAHNGSVKDAASMWHAGVPYDRAAAEGRADSLGTKTTDYADRVAAATSGDGGGAALDLSDLGTPTPPSTEAPAPMSGAAAGVESHEKELETAGRNTNVALGLDPENALGHYTARVNTNVTNALRDFFQGASDITHPADFQSAISSLAKIIHPLGLPGEVVTDLVWRAANDTGFAAAHPDLASGLAVGLGAATGALLPGGFAGEAERMPLQGTAALRQAAAETAIAAEQAGATATATRAAGEAATAEAAQAAEAAAPSTAATQRAKTALTPSGAAEPVAAGGAAVQSSLKEQLATAKSMAGGIYDTAVANAQDAGKTLDPSQYQALSAELADVRSKLGTLPPSAEAAVSNLENRINTGQRVTPNDLNAYKAAIDTTFPGKMKAGTEVRGMLRSMFSDDDREWAEAADSVWRDQIAGRSMSPTSLGNLVKLVKKNDAPTVVEKLFGSGTSDAQANMAQAVMRRLDPETQDALREATFARLLKPDAEGKIDPSDVLKAYDNWHPNFRSTMTNPGAEQFFNVERQIQNEAARTAAAAKGAGQATTEAERAATGAQRTAESAAKAAQAPNKLATWMARGLKFTGIGVTEALAKQFDVPFIGGAAGLAEFLLPTNRIAKFLANSREANLLARALKTPANSAVVPTLLQQLRDSDLGKELLSSPEGQQKQNEAQQVVEAANAP
jgi:hypothetical protein